MKNELLKGTLITMAVLLVAAFILGMNGFVQAWSEPDAGWVPPLDGDIAAPLNVGGGLQEKTGQLQLDPNSIAALNSENALSVYAQNGEHAAIYAEQNAVSCTSGEYCWSGYFSGDFAIDGHIYTTGGQSFGLPIPSGSKALGGGETGPDGEEFIATFNQSILVENGDKNANLCVNGNADGECIKNFRPNGFQCNRGDSSCGVGFQSTCNAKCQAATIPKSGFCTSAWTLDKGVMGNFSCDDSSPSGVTIKCNCLYFD